MELENKRRKKDREKYEKKEKKSKKSINDILEEQMTINAKTRIASVNIEHCVKALLVDDNGGKIEKIDLGMAEAKIYYKEKDDIPRNIFCDIQKFGVLGVLKTLYDDRIGWSTTSDGLGLGSRTSYVIEITPYHNVA